jgi:hypothetical protein
MIKEDYGNHEQRIDEYYTATINCISESYLSWVFVLLFKSRWTSYITLQHTAKKKAV